jgi:Cd(II)/Pb(II)-responsive transcriptional regulator
MKNRLKIGELAKLAGCKAETIRYYENEHLMPAPFRSEGNYRLYDETHLERLQFIRRCRTLGMTLEEIRALLHMREVPQRSCEKVDRLLDEHIAHVEARIAELVELQSHLKQLRAQCQGNPGTDECGILQQLQSPEQESLTPIDAHTDGCH